MTDLYDEPRRRPLAESVDGWLSELAVVAAAIEAIDHGDELHGEDPRWYVRIAGEAKEHITVWLTLGQRTLRYEAYVMPAPLDHVAEVYETCLRANQRLVGVHFAIGVEDAVFVRGEVPLAALDAEELDRVIGTVVATVEDFFPTLIRLGQARHFR